MLGDRMLLAMPSRAILQLSDFVRDKQNLDMEGGLAAFWLSLPLALKYLSDISGWGLEALELTWHQPRL